MSCSADEEKHAIRATASRYRPKLFKEGAWSLRSRPLLRLLTLRTATASSPNPSAPTPRAMTASGPSYPLALAEAVLASLPGRRALDAGVGTGLSSLPFREAGVAVLGVDADARMAEIARSRGFEAEVHRVEQWDTAGNVFDAVISGQAWHWIDPVAGAAKAASVLRPGGRLAPFWNIADPEPDMAAAFANVYRSVDTGLASIPWTTPALGSYQRIFAPAIDGIHAAGAFTEPDELRFHWQDTITRDTWLEQVPLTRGHNRIPADRLAALLDGLGQAIDRHGGSFTMHYTTVAITVTRAQIPPSRLNSCRSEPVSQARETGL